MRCKNVAKLSETLSDYKNFHPFIHVSENDGDNRFRTGSINNADSAHAQRKTALNGRKRFSIPEISVSYRKSGSLNPMALS